MGNKEKKTEKMLQVLFAVSAFSSVILCYSLPQWEELNCEANHKYFFSDSTLNWQDAREECELYGGWLLSINILQEQNCLVRHASKAVQDGWFWHDATDRETESVYVHAKDNSDLTWVPHRWRCSSSTNDIYSYVYDYVIIGLYGKAQSATGAWCAEPETNVYYYICEGLISNKDS